MNFLEKNREENSGDESEREVFHGALNRFFFSFSFAKKEMTDKDFVIMGTKEEKFLYISNSPLRFNREII